MALDGRNLTVQADGQHLTASKAAAETFVFRVDAAAWLDGRGTITGTPTAVADTGTGGTAPTVALQATEYGTVLPIKVSAGTTGWVGHITITLTSTYDAEVKVQVIDFTVT